MSNLKKKLLSLGLTGLMAASLLAGCTGNTQTPNNSGNTGGNSQAAATTYPKAPDNYTISVLTVSHDGQIIKADHPNVLALQDHTGYKISLEYILNANYAEQINTRLAGGNLPGLIVITGNTGPVVSAAKAGAFWDITDKYKNYEYLALADENVMQNISVEGRIYGIYRSRTIGRNGITYRSDWLENLGMKEPTNLDEFYEMLRAFTYNDPDKNGANDTYGTSWCVYMGPFRNLAVMHGAPNYWGFDDSGKIYPWFESDAYVAAMDYSKRLYDEGLINKDFAALQTGDWLNDFNTGKAGAIIDVADQANRLAVNLKNNNFMTQDQVDDGSMVWVMSPISNSKGESYTMPTTGHAGYVAVTRSGAKTETDLHYYLDFLDKCNDEIGQNILNFGVEGVTYELTDEGFVKRWTAEEITAKAGAGLEITTGWNQFMMNTKSFLLSEKNNPRQVRQNEVYEQNLEFAVHNPTLSLTSDTYTGKGSTLELIIEDATINYIMGKIDLAAFNKEVQRWYSEGGQTAINEFQAAYDAIHAK